MIHHHLPRPPEVGIALQDTPITGARLQHTVADTRRLGGSKDAVGVASCIVPHLVEGRRLMSIYQAMSEEMMVVLEHRRHPGWMEEAMSEDIVTMDRAR
jgi:hypothetical protein